MIGATVQADGQGLCPLSGAEPIMAPHHAGHHGFWGLFTPAIFNVTKKGSRVKLSGFGILLALSMTLSVEAEPLKIASWNMQWLSNTLNKGQVKRNENDYQVIARYPDQGMRISLRYRRSRERKA